MLRRTLVVMAAVSLVAGCGSTLSVAGQFIDGSETFAGSATAQGGGAGTVNIVSNKGVKCTGTFVYVTERTGSGTFTCTNGESGPFNFVSTGWRGTATGMIGGRPVTFSFG